MFARLAAKAILAAAAIGMVFFGVGLLGMALASFLARALGIVGGYTMAGLVLLVPPLIWAVFARFSRPKKPSAPINNELTRVLIAAVAKQTPWIAILGAGLVGAANMFLNRNKTPK